MPGDICLTSVEPGDETRFKLYMRELQTHEITTRQAFYEHMAQVEKHDITSASANFLLKYRPLFEEVPSWASTGSKAIRQAMATSKAMHARRRRSSLRHHVEINDEEVNDEDEDSDVKVETMDDPGPVHRRVVSHGHAHATTVPASPPNRDASPGPASHTPRRPVSPVPPVGPICEDTCATCIAKGYMHVSHPRLRFMMHEKVDEIRKLEAELLEVYRELNKHRNGSNEGSCGGREG